MSSYYVPDISSGYVSENLLFSWNVCSIRKLFGIICTWINNVKTLAEKKMDIVESQNKTIC